MDEEIEVVRVVLISDTHGKHDQVQLPEGDMLIHAGDMTMSGTVTQIKAFGDWFSAQPHKVKICCPGNHDFAFEDRRKVFKAREALGNVIYLNGGETTVLGLRVWASGVTPWFHDWAFNVQRGPEIAAHWAKIPDGIDILVTHGPPYGILDRTSRGELVGCQDLLARVTAIAPRLHVFGHIHEAYGIHRPVDTCFVNASTCNLRYEPVNPPVVYNMVVPHREVTP